jgi:hypothetical protein
MAGLRTEFEFTLPKGYLAADGVLHRRGTMRLATARDEIEPLRDRSIEGPDDPYLTVLVLGRVITSLGTLASVGPREIEGLFAADLAFLQDLYGIVNFGDQRDVAALQASVLPDEPDAPAEPGEQLGDEQPHDEQPGDDEFGMVTLPDLDDATTVAAAESTRGESSPRRRGRIEEVTSRSPG